MQLESTRRASDDLTVLVVAPTGRDAALLCRALGRAGIRAQQCPSCQEAGRQMMQGGAAIIVAEEALDEAEIQRFSELIAHQPPWSDFPLILLTLSGAVTADSQRRRLLRAPLVRALELERPIRPETLISTVQVAIRTRLRQYELRDQMVRQQMVQDALLQSEKLAVVGRLAATIAHEINNPLEAATNLVYLARTTPDDAKRREYLLMAESELARVAAIATETLKFYRQPNKATQVQIGPIFDSLLTLYHQKLRSAQIKVCTDFKTDRPILAFSGELRQVFSNLLTNAIDASRGATLTIRTKPAVSRSGIPGIKVVFADGGSGIPERLRDKIFEPFITTKGSSGTGLGLWVTAQLVQKHGGTIRVKSSTHPQRHGTVFSIFLPEAPPMAQPQEESAQAAAVGATRDRKDDTRISA